MIRRLHNGCQLIWPAVSPSAHPTHPPTPRARTPEQSQLDLRALELKLAKERIARQEAELQQVLTSLRRGWPWACTRPGVCWAAPTRALTRCSRLSPPPPPSFIATAAPFPAAPGARDAQEG